MFERSQRVPSKTIICKSVRGKSHRVSYWGKNISLCMPAHSWMGRSQLPFQNNNDVSDGQKPGPRSESQKAAWQTVRRSSGDFGLGRIQGPLSEGLPKDKCLYFWYMKRLTFCVDQFRGKLTKWVHLETSHFFWWYVRTTTIFVVLCIWIIVWVCMCVCSNAVFKKST